MLSDARWRRSRGAREGARCADRLGGVRAPPARPRPTPPGSRRRGRGLPGGGARSSARRPGPRDRAGPQGGGGAGPRRAGVARRGRRRAPALVGGPALRGDQPLARGLGPPGGRGPSAPSGEGPVRPRHARTRGDARPRPHPRRDPTGRAGQGDRAPAGRARRPVGGARVRAHRRGRAPRRVRRPRGCAGRVPRHLAPAGASGVLGRRDRVAARVRPVLPAVDRSGRPRRGAARPRARPRRGSGRARTGARAEIPRSVPRRARTDRGGPARRRAGGARPAAVRRDARARRAPARGLVGRGLGGPPNVRSSPSRVPGRDGARRGVPLAGTARDPRSGGRDRRPCPAAPDRVHRRHRHGARGMGQRAGQSSRARETGVGAQRARVPRDAHRPGSRLAGTRPRVRRPSRRRSSRGRSAVRVRLPRRQARRRDRGGPVRFAPPHPRRAAVHESQERLDRRGARGRGLRRPPGARRRPVRRRAAAGDRRLRTRLHGARVRVGRPALGPHRPGRDGGEVRRRGDPEAVTSGDERLGADDRARQARREGHGRRARAPVLRPDVDRASALRSRYAVADGARGRVPARRDGGPGHGHRGGQGRSLRGRVRWTG